MKERAGRLSAVVAVVLLASCISMPAPSATSFEVTTPARTAAAGSTEEIVRARADQVIGSLRDRDTGALAALAHPSKGIRFSPYTYVRDQDLVFGAALLQGPLVDQTRYLWGFYDGSGEPIELTFSEYYGEFVYDQDFANAEQIGYDEALGSGNTINNVAEFYPEGVFVEYHFSGFDAEYGGMDWVSLRLVFEQEGGVWYLVAVVHDEWTI